MGLGGPETWCLEGPHDGALAALGGGFPTAVRAEEKDLARRDPAFPQEDLQCHGQCGWMAHFRELTAPKLGVQGSQTLELLYLATVRA